MSQDTERIIGAIKEDPIYSSFIEKEILKYDVLNISPIVEYCYFLAKVTETSFQSEYYAVEEIDQNFEIRAELIKDVFLIEEFEISTGILHYWYHEESVLNIKYTLYLKLLYSIFLMKGTTDHGVEEIFMEFYKEWEQFLKYETFPVSFIITLPNLVIDEDIEVIKNRIFFRKSSTVKCISNNNWISRYPTLLYYRRKMSGKLYPTMKERNDNYLEYNERFEEEYKQVIFELQELVVTLYLHDIDFEYFPFFMKLPWWFTFNIEQFEKLERYSFKEKYKLSTSQIIIGDAGCATYWLLVTKGPFKGEIWMIGATLMQPCIPNIDFLGWYEMWLDCRDTYPEFWDGLKDRVAKKVAEMDKK